MLSKNIEILSFQEESVVHSSRTAVTINYLLEIFDISDDDVSKLQYLEMCVNTDRFSIDNLGVLLPELHTLKFIDSNIPSIRYLGTHLLSLKILYVCNCSLNHLEGISTLCNLKELYASFNFISDISPLGVLENLALLDLEGNLISEDSQLTYLSLCKSLKNLTIEGNPICTTRSSLKRCRQTILLKLSHIEILDGIDITQFTNEIITTSLNDSSDDIAAENLFLSDSFSDLFKTIYNREYLEGTIMNDISINTTDVIDRPYTSFSYCHPTQTFYLHKSFCSDTHLLNRDNSNRPKSSCELLQKSNIKLYEHFHTATQRSKIDGYSGDEQSEMTHGTSVCGNLTHSLRGKRLGKKRRDRRSRIDHISESIDSLDVTDVPYNLLFRKDNNNNNNNNININKESSIIDTNGEFINSILKELTKWKKSYAINTELITRMSSEQDLSN